MIQCALNGGYGRSDHPLTPVTLRQIVADAQACRDAGASSVHLHPRDPATGSQTLGAAVHDAVVVAIRSAVPQLEVSCSTSQDIDLGGATDRIAAVRAWTAAPDVVSVNLVEEGAVELGTALLECGIGIEAGLFDERDAASLLAAPWARRVRRVLVETIFERDPNAAVELAQAIDARVAELDRPRVWHGDGLATWAVVDAGLAAGVGVRVGLEDALVGRDGRRAPGNPDQVRATIARTTSHLPTPGS